jgi:predicted small secreted protein
MKNLKLTLVLSAVTASVLCSSCATSRGFGRDLQKVGDKIETKADETGGTR